MTSAQCVQTLQAGQAEPKTPAITYEKKLGVLVWFADITNRNNWLGCWPEDWDPR